MVRKVTTQSAHAAPRTVQVSQSMIMARTLTTTTDTPSPRDFDTHADQGVGGDVSARG